MDSNRDFVTNKGGRMILLIDGDTLVMDGDVVATDGTIIRTNGVMLMPDGTTRMMMEDEALVIDHAMTRMLTPE